MCSLEFRPFTGWEESCGLSLGRQRRVYSSWPVHLRVGEMPGITNDVCCPYPACGLDSMDPETASERPCMWVAGGSGDQVNRNTWSQIRMVHDQPF